MFSLLIIGFSVVALGLNVFLHYTENPWFNATFIILALGFLVVAGFALSKRQGILRKQEFTIKEILHTLGINGTDVNLSDVRGKIDTLKQKNTKYINDKAYLKSKIKLFSYDFKTMLKLFNYIKDQENELLNELINTLKDGLNKNYESSKHLLDEVGSYKTNYNNIDDKKVFYDGCTAAIVVQNPLKAFLLKLYLMEFGIEVNIFNDGNIYYDCFNLVFIDEELANIDKPHMIFFGNSSRQNRFYINEELDKTELRYALDKFLANKQIVKTVESAYSVLIFGESYMQSSIWLGVGNSCTSGNKVVDNITDFKAELKNAYKMVIVNYVAIKYDYENIKNALFAFKNNFIYAKVVFYLGNNCDLFDLEYDFADIVIKEELPKSKFIKMFRDNL